MPFWHARSIAGTMIVCGQLLQAYNMWLTARSGVPVAKQPAPAAA
jgi:cbb3-type cytochrome oxidase subunit 1